MPASEQPPRDENSNTDEILKRAFFEIGESIVLDTDCATIEHQALKDMYYEGDRHKLYIGDADPNKVINIFGTGNRLALTFLDTHEQGTLAIDERSNLLMIRGSLFIDPAQPPNDAYSQTVTEALFADNNLPSRILLSKIMSLPLLAAKGQVVEGGYLVMSRAYTIENVQDEIRQGRLDEAKLLNTGVLTIVKQQRVYWGENMLIAPNPITEIRV